MQRLALTGYLACASVTGAAVLAVEILGTRVISPYFGGTIVIWTAQISVTLVALALGYLAGGWLIDRRPEPGCLHGAILAAGIWLFGVELTRASLMPAALHLGLYAGAIGTASVLFLPPLLLLGMVSPMVIRLSLPSVGRAGKISGTVYAVSTLGSVVGAILTGFVLVQFVGTGRLLLGTASVLSVTGVVGLFASGRRRAGALACPLLAVLWLTAGGPRSDAGRCLYSARSVYGRHLVVEDHGRRYLCTDGFLHSAVDPETLENRAAYIVALELLPFMRPTARRALHIGLGGGVLPTLMLRYYDIQSDVVEIDPQVATIARTYFGFVPSGELYLEDGRTFLAGTGQHYDLIVIDAFLSDRQPWHLFTRECFAAARRAMPVNGVLAINTFGYKSGAGARAWQAVVRTLRLDYANVVVYAAAWDPNMDDHSVNIVIFASDAALDVVRDLATARPWPGVRLLRLDLDRVPAAGILLTDDYNPLDCLTAAVFLPARRSVLTRLGPELLAD